MGDGIVPAVKKLSAGTGDLKLRDGMDVTVQYADPRLRSAADLIARHLSESGIKAGDNPSSGNASSVRFSLAIAPERIREPEGYRLRLSEGAVEIEGHCPAGVFHGVQTLRQLLPSGSEPNDELNIPGVEIFDFPRFSWRGFMLDESRHFFGKEYVRKILDWMALLKLNRFHWHLTDEPAWRIEIKAYPRLAEIGASGSWSDPEAPPAFYSQDDIREIVAYAAERHIVIIPEIDMPGHATAANRAYPEFSGGGSQRLPEFTFNPGREETYAYLETILDEVMDLFPGPWLHFGGDEVHYGNEQWATNPDVQSLMRKHGLPDLKAVEFHFIKRMADFIVRRGRTPVGWDETVDSSIAPESAAVMWWRHDRPEALATALRKGYATILCPRIPCYFDFVQHGSHQWGRRWQGDFGTVEGLYRYPDEAIIGADACRHIIGISGNLWTERVKGAARADFMIFPRLFALAEAGWTHDSEKNLESFNRRAAKMFPVMDAEGTSYFNHLAPESTPEIPGVDKATGPGQIEEEMQASANTEIPPLNLMQDKR